MLPLTPPTPPLPFNHNHRAMIMKYSGAIWNSALGYFLQPITEEEIEPLMYIDSLSGAPVLLLDPHELGMVTLPSTKELTQPIQVVLKAVSSTEEVTQHSVVLPLVQSLTSHVVPSRRTKKVQSTLTLPKSNKKDTFTT
jgi:hypothetical protein